MNMPTNRHKTPLSELAKRYNRSLQTMERWAKEAGLTKTREQYERDAAIRRETVYKMRQSGMEWREIAENLGISVVNAKKLDQRHKQTLKTTLN